MRSNIQLAWQKEELQKEGHFWAVKRDNFPLRRSHFSCCWIIEQKKCRCWWWSKKGLSLTAEAAGASSASRAIFFEPLGRLRRYTHCCATNICIATLWREKWSQLSRHTDEHQHTHSRLMLILAFDIHSYMESACKKFQMYPPACIILWAVLPPADDANVIERRLMKHPAAMSSADMNSAMHSMLFE